MANLFSKRKQGLVSMVIPTYNRQKYIEEALNSLKNQTFKNIEVIIIDDGSTDNTEGIIKTWYKNNMEPFKNFIYLKLPRNRDEEWATNIGFCLTTGEYIGILHSDDVSHEERLQKQVDYLLKHPETAAVGGNFLYCENSISNITTEPDWLCYDRDLIEMYYKDKVSTWVKHCVSWGSVLFRPLLLQDIIGFKRIYESNDWYFILEIVNHDYIVDNINEIMFYYRMHNDQKCHTKPNSINYFANKRKQIKGRVSVVLPVYRKQNNILNALKNIFRSNL